VSPPLSRPNARMNTHLYANQKRISGAPGIISRSSRDINSVGGWADDALNAAGNPTTGNSQRTHKNRADDTLLGSNGMSNHGYATHGSRAPEAHQYFKSHITHHDDSKISPTSSMLPNLSLWWLVFRYWYCTIASKHAPTAKTPSEASINFSNGGALSCSSMHAPDRITVPCLYPMTRFQASLPRFEPWTSECPRFRIVGRKNRTIQKRYFKLGGHRL